VSRFVQLQAIARGLNERQRAYLLAVYAEDQIREAGQRRRRSLPARTWRWIEYGPVSAKRLDNSSTFLLRRELERVKLVDRGTGATWSALVKRGLVKSRHAHTGLADARTGRPIVSLLVQMTSGGRKVARIIKGEPVIKLKGRKPLSLSALRLIAYGQEHPNEEFEWRTPWEGAMHVPDYVVMLGVVRGLIKRGLLCGNPPYRLRITKAGQTMEVLTEPNWKPLRRFSTDGSFH
jgi:hypothetical protein